LNIEIILKDDKLMKIFTCTNISVDAFSCFGSTSESEATRTTMKPAPKRKAPIVAEIAVNHPRILPPVSRLKQKQQLVRSGIESPILKLHFFTD
jgi:hypothetical protein